MPGGESRSMKIYELKFLPLFENDLNEIIDYIAGTLGNPIAASAMVDEVEKAIHVLSTMVLQRSRDSVTTSTSTSITTTSITNVAKKERLESSLSFVISNLI